MKHLLALFLLSLSLHSENEWRLHPVANPEVISLQKAISLAEQRNFEIKKQRAQVDQAAAKVWLAATKLIPDLSFAATHQIWGKPDMSRVGGIFNVPLFDAKAAVENKAQAESLKAARLSLDFARERVIHRVASFYVEALLAKAILAVAAEEHEKFLKQQETIRRKAALGEARSLDLTNALYQSHKSKSDQILKERDYQRKLAELGNELAVSDVFEITMFNIESPSLKLEPEAMLALAHTSFDVQALKKELSSREITKTSEALGFLPTLKASVEGGYPLYASPKHFSSEIMLKLELPLFNGGARLAHLKEHQAQLTLHELSLRQKEAEKNMGVYGALDQISAYERAQESSKLALDAAELASSSAERLFGRGEITGLNLVDANVQLFSAKFDLVEARLKLMQSQLGLLFLIGRLKDLSNN